MTIQFTKRGGFTQRVGNFVVTGHYRLPGENDPPTAPNEYFLEGDAHVFFGGVEFCLARGNDESLLIFRGQNDAGEVLLPERMIVSGDSLNFVFPGGTELEFSTLYTSGTMEMRISGVFQEDTAGMELPFKPMRKTGIRETAEGQLVVSAEGINYSFGRSPMDTGRRTLLLMAGAGPVSYRVIPEQNIFTPDDFIIPAAAAVEAYDEAITRWRDQNYSIWNRTISEQNNEDVIIAFQREAIRRGTYRAAVAAVPAVFLRGSSRTYESSVYLGGLDQAYRSLVTGDRDKLARLSRLISEKSLDFLKEYRVFEYFAVREQQNLIDSGADLIRAIDPAILALDIIPGILEGYLDWMTIRAGTENPFERLVDQACFVISESLRRSEDIPAARDYYPVTYSWPGAESTRIHVFFNNEADTEFNLRLGKDLVDFAESVNDDSWAGIGRSLILSALSLGDNSGAVKAGLSLSNGSVTESPARLTSARLYRIICPAAFSPRASALVPAPNPIWAWTAAESISAVSVNNSLDITVGFPVGETHHMIIRGIRPFSRIQIYNMDYRSDPQFERYESPGWVYYAQEQTLVVKMRHRAAEEHIRIFFR